MKKGLKKIGILLIVILCFMFGCSDKDNNENTKNKLDIEREKDDVPYKYFKITSDNELSDDENAYIVDILTCEAQACSDESEVELVKISGTNYIKIFVPNMNKYTIFEELISNTKIELIGAFGTSEEEVCLALSEYLIEVKVITTEDETIDKVYYGVSFTLNEEGAKLFEEATTKYIGKAISIVLNGNVISSPTVMNAITSGECCINGMESYEEAEKLACQIRVSGYHLKLEEVK